MLKPLTPHHEPSQENNHPNQALLNPYIKYTPTSPQVVSHPPFPIPPINSHVTYTQAPPQSNNQTQHTPPLSPSREILVDDINQLQDLSNLLAMHLSQQQNNIPLSPYSPNLPYTLNINQVETHVRSRKMKGRRAKGPMHHPLPALATCECVFPPNTRAICPRTLQLQVKVNIVEDAKVERPLDTSLASACRYTKHSQELLEYVIGTTYQTSTHNTPPQVEHQKTNSTNAPGIPSTRVNGASAASRSKPRSNTKKDRTLPAKSALKQVEAHSRMNKSNEKQKNRVDSSISYKRTCPLTRNTPPKVLPTKQWKPTGRLLPLERQCPLVRSTALKSGYMPTDPLENMPSVAYNLSCTNQSDPNYNWGSNLQTYDWRSSRLRNFVKKFIGIVRFGNDHFGAIMGYGDYVIGDSVISRVYYVEGLRHNLFSISQFCDSDLEVAFRKHTCFVRDLDGVDLIKGNHGTNLYTISVKDMMRSSPICLLSKASKVLVMASSFESLKLWYLK
ncbi:hypothetical protein Tco_0542540 [Tanacetum coccineum]